MALFFHQNMRTFGGGSMARNLAYNGPVPPGGGGAFGAIRVAVDGPPPGPIVVGGFTEIVNNVAAAGALANSAGSLGVGWGAGSGGVVTCGRTALARGREHIGVGIAAGWALVTVGQIFLNSAGGAISLVHQRAATFAGLNLLGLPAGATLDYRGLVYVVVTVPNGPNIAVGFLHNLYTFLAQRALVAGQLPMIAKMMGTSANGLPAVGAIAARYIGGDFNVPVTSPRGTLRQGLPLYAYSAGLAARRGGTTWSGSLYDYWYSDIKPAGPAPPGLIVPVASVFANTLNHGPRVRPAGTMSDHAGVGLQVT
jgi:hypothetical protein